MYALLMFRILYFSFSPKHIPTSFRHTQLLHFGSTLLLDMVHAGLEQVTDMGSSLFNPMGVLNNLFQE